MDMKTTSSKMTNTTNVTPMFSDLAPSSRMEVANALSNEPNSRDARELRHMPYANRLISLQTAMVPPKVDGTSERVAEIVKGLANQGAIYTDQMGAIHSDLLNRAYTWNSMGVQESIQALVNDVIHGQNRALQDEMSRTKEIANASLLTRFFESIYKTVDRGQRNFEGFKKLLRMFINNVPNAEVYSSGGSFSLQINMDGTSQNINLTNAFNNLKDIWGAKWDAVNNPRIGALLTPNTRALIFFMSAFYNHGTFEPGSYIDNLMRLYKEAIKADVDTEGDAIFDLQEAGVSLSKRFNEYKDTLNYLLTNRQYVPPSTSLELSQDQLNLLRYLMRQLKQALKDGINPEISISTMAQFLDPTVYQTNKYFIERLQDYLLTAQMRNPDFYKSIVLNDSWVPPNGIYTGEFVIPERYDFDLASEAEYGGPSRDEYIDDTPYEPSRPAISSSNQRQLQDEIESLINNINNELGVQSQAGWIADHRLPGIINNLNLGSRSLPDFSMDSDSSRSVVSGVDRLSLNSRSNRRRPRRIEFSDAPRAAPVARVVPNIDASLIPLPSSPQPLIAPPPPVIENPVLPSPPSIGSSYSPPHTLSSMLQVLDEISPQNNWRNNNLQRPYPLLPPPPVAALNAAMPIRRAPRFYNPNLRRSPVPHYAASENGSNSNSFNGSGACFWSSLKPSVGGNRQRGLAHGLVGTGRNVKDNSLLKRAITNMSLKNGKKLRFY
ncbi:capsid protein precursor pIIIa [Crane-associated adenovirus 1]|uniref:Capsid protein pIIIa n=1 Tax=Crane-associated adenovirus 1 TaxID=2559941 RepID=A0A5H2WY30_9ADEN|nr:capsid protein precursor pIIIa [Crane-associated adenovirus 1]